MSTGLDRKEDGNLARVLELAQTPSKPDRTELIHRVIDQCLISMVFQPIVDLKTGRIFAYEALCRSREPAFETPPELIEAATEVGRVGELGRLQRTLASRNCPDWPIFVNISPNEFDEGYLVRPDDAIFRHRQPVYVEITESVPLVFFQQCHSVLAELRRKGARLAIDDLGAGYSNLKYIADLAPDIVKLDRELVAGCTMEGHQYELLRSISQLCSQVNARVVAEGVENPEELEAVSSVGIDFCQGFFLGRPKISPSELSWPASELVGSPEFQVRRATHVAERCEASAEDTERRLEDLEEMRAILERSVRKAKGEVVRLRKAVTKAETDSELAQTRLSELESSLAESETSRRRMARLFEAAALKTREEPPPEPPAPKRKIRMRQILGQGLIWAAGLAAGLALYLFEPLGGDVKLREVAGPAAPASVVDSETPAPPPPAEASPPAPIVTPVEASPRAPVVTPAEEGPVIAAAREEVREVVLDWASAWSDQDVDRYVGRYGADFASESGLSGRAWREQRRERLTTPRFIRVELDDLEISLEGEGVATATFFQAYASDTYSDRTRKRLELVREPAGWRIVRELSIE